MDIYYFYYHHQSNFIFMHMLEHYVRIFHSKSKSFVDDAEQKVLKFREIYVGVE